MSTTTARAISDSIVFSFNDGATRAQTVTFLVLQHAITVAQAQTLVAQHPVFAFAS